MLVETGDVPRFVEECNVNQAVQALYKVKRATPKKKGKKRLFAEEVVGKINLRITLKKIPPMDNSKILTIFLPNPFNNTKTLRICFFVKDLVDKDSDVDESKIHYKEYFEGKDIKFLSEIIPLYQLRSEFTEHEQKRNLCKSYDLFLMDSRLAAYMPKLLGSHFYKRNRLPIKIKMVDKFVKRNILRVVNSTLLYINGNGRHLNVQVGVYTQSEEQINENVMAIINYIRDKIPGGWENVQLIQIRTPSLLSIPIYVSETPARDIVFPKKECRPDVPIIDELTETEDIAVYPDGRVQILPRKRKLITQTNEVDPDMTVEENSIDCKKKT